MAQKTEREGGRKEEQEREGEAGVTRKLIGGGQTKREGLVLRLGRKECEAAAPGR